MASSDGAKRNNQSHRQCSHSLHPLDPKSPPPAMLSQPPAAENPPPAMLSQPLALENPSPAMRSQPPAPESPSPAISSRPSHSHQNREEQVNRPSISEPPPHHSLQRCEELLNGMSISESQPSHPSQIYEEHLYGACMPASQPSHVNDQPQFSTPQPPHQRDVQQMARGYAVPADQMPEPRQEIEPHLQDGALSQSQPSHQRPRHARQRHASNRSVYRQPRLPQEHLNAYALSEDYRSPWYRHLNGSLEFSHRNIADGSDSSDSDEEQLYPYPIGPYQDPWAVYEQRVPRSPSPNLNHPYERQSDRYNFSGSQSFNQREQRQQERDETNASTGQNPNRQREELTQNTPEAYHNGTVGHRNGSSSGGEVFDWIAEAFPTEDLQNILAVARQLEARSSHETTQSQGENQPTTRSQGDNGQSNLNQQHEARRQPIPQEEEEEEEEEDMSLFESMSRDMLRNNLPGMTRWIEGVLQSRGVNAQGFEPSGGQNGRGNHERTSTRSGSALSTTTIEMSTRSFQYGSQKNQNCSICLMELENGENVRCLRCKHLFHRDCIDRWLSDHRSCPLCRLDVEGSCL